MNIQNVIIKKIHFPMGTFGNNPSSIDLSREIAEFIKNGQNVSDIKITAGHNCSSAIVAFIIG